MGSLSEGFCLWVSLSGDVSVQGVSVQGGQGPCPRGSLSRGSLLGSPQTETPCMVTSRQYVSYWNAFLFK